MNIREATFEWMRARGIHHIFGNPGSTELPFLVNLPDSVRYVLALQESIAVAMADGYAQASGQPALINLHVAPGLGKRDGRAVHRAEEPRAADCHLRAAGHAPYFPRAAAVGRLGGHGAPRDEVGV
jgi:benzoylformate decarboxylase